jgi:hypothetical protein
MPFYETAKQAAAEMTRDEAQNYLRQLFNEWASYRAKSYGWKVDMQYALRKLYDDAVEEFRAKYGEPEFECDMVMGKMPVWIDGV